MGDRLRSSRPKCNWCWQPYNAADFMEVPVGEQLAKLPNSCLRQLPRRQFRPRIDLHAVGPQLRGDLDRSTQWLTQAACLNSDFEGWHDCEAFGLR